MPISPVTEWSSINWVRSQRVKGASVKSWTWVVSFDPELFDRGKPAIWKKGDMVVDRLGEIGIVSMKMAIEYVLVNGRIPMLRCGEAPWDAGGTSKVLKMHHYGGTSKNSWEDREDLDYQKDWNEVKKTFETENSHFNTIKKGRLKFTKINHLCGNNWGRNQEATGAGSSVGVRLTRGFVENGHWVKYFLQWDEKEP